MSVPGVARVADADDKERLTRRILRVNHAGEHGAMAIYAAQVARLTRQDAQLVAWLQDTLAHETRHREMFRTAMPSRGAKPCRAMVVWAVGGAVLGSVTALLGPCGVMVCTAAVERTVHRHLDDQVSYLHGRDDALAKIIREIQSEEDSHLAYAEAHHNPRSLGARLLSAVISAATEMLICLSTRGDSLRLTATLRAADGAAS